MDDSSNFDTWIHEPFPEDEEFNIWSVTTDKVEGHKFKWDAYGAAEISKAKMIRFDIRG